MLTRKEGKDEICKIGFDNQQPVGFKQPSKGSSKEDKRITCKKREGHAAKAWLTC
jgi:hypothetical protein